MSSIPKYEIDEALAKLRISQGNSKIGKQIFSFSTLPGNESHLLYAKGELLTDIPGTCGKHCDACFNSGCYACNSAKVHHNACIPAWADNTLLLRNGALWGELEAKLQELNKKYIASEGKAPAKCQYFRINVSGECSSVNDFEQWNLLAEHHLETVFGVYTKNYEDLGTFLERHPGGYSKNFIINVSQWHGCADEFLKRFPEAQLNVFEYDDSNLKKNTLSEEDKERLSKLPHCPAVTKDGKHAKNPDGSDKTCSQCKLCYKDRDKARIIAVYAH